MHPSTPLPTLGPARHPEAPPAAALPVPCLASRSLFGDAREIHIDHEGQLYRLRITALGKLILTK
jgi:hemin uptake protein HemP